MQLKLDHNKISQYFPVPNSARKPIVYIFTIIPTFCSKYQHSCYGLHSINMVQRGMEIRTYLIENMLLTCVM